MGRCRRDSEGDAPERPEPGPRHFKSALKAAGLPQEIRFHDFRHAHATLLVGLGVDVKTVQERLGHSEAGITLDTYTHVTAGIQRTAAAKLDEAMAPKRETLRKPH